MINNHKYQEGYWILINYSKDDFKKAWFNEDDKDFKRSELDKAKDKINVIFIKPNECAEIFSLQELLEE